MLPPKALDQKDKLYDYLTTLGIQRDQVKDEKLMCTAFIHKSYASDYAGDFVHNERLEFLGDSVLSAVVAKNIYQNYPERTEADLTLYKIALVRAENLALVAQEIGLDKVILLGNGEEKNNGRAKTTILCDCLEALLGYLSLDFPADTVENIIEKHILDKLAGHTEMSMKSYKSHLQEFIQKKYKLTPHYEEKEIGKNPDTHELMYSSDVYMENQLLGSGTGTNKKKAQEEAAKNAYEKLI